MKYAAKQVQLLINVSKKHVGCDQMNVKLHTYLIFKWNFLNIGPVYWNMAIICNVHIIKCISNTSEYKIIEGKWMCNTNFEFYILVCWYKSIFYLDNHFRLCFVF